MTFYYIQIVFYQIEFKFVEWTGVVSEFILQSWSGNVCFPEER